MQRQEMAYRIYVSDCLRILTENTAKQIALTPKPSDTDVTGAYIKARFWEPYKPTHAKDAPSGDEVVADVLKLLGLG